MAGKRLRLHGLPTLEGASSWTPARHNNPYARSLRSNDRGLARVSAAPSGTLIHFATRPGSVAADGTGSNGPYTSQLLRFIDAADVPVETMLKRVSAAVTVESKKQQEPWTEGSIVGEFYFKPGATATTIKPEPVTSDAQVELQAWTAAQRGNAWEWVQDVWHENH